jgi:hypothetical protein
VRLPARLRGHGFAIALGAIALAASTNCADAYRGRNIGWLGKDCAKPLPGDEGERSQQWLDQAFDYIGERPGRAAVVAGVRGLRIAGLYQPFRAAHEQERNVKLQQAGIGVFYVLAALAVAGVVLLRRRGSPMIVLATPLVVALVTAMAGWGSLRLRHAAEPSVVVLAAVAAAPLGFRKWRPTRG